MKKKNNNFQGRVYCLKRPLKSVRYALACFMAVIGLSGCFGYDTYHPQIQVPKVLPFTEMRQPISMELAKPILNNGKIVIYESYLLVNEPGKGIHVFDNAAPENPLALGFLAIAGNTDIVVKNNFLYANNYVDLVALDISDMSDVKTVQRNKDMFLPRYDPATYGVDPGDGVIIAFEYVR